MVRPGIEAVTVAFVTPKISLTFTKMGWADEVNSVEPDGGFTLT